MQCLETAGGHIPFNKMTIAKMVIMPLEGTELIRRPYSQ